MQATHKPFAFEIREDIAHMKTKLGLVLKYFTGGAEKEHAVNNFTKPPLPIDEIYYEKDSYAMNEHTGHF